MSSAVADVPTAADVQTSAVAADVAVAACHALAVTVDLLATTVAAVHVLVPRLRSFMCCFYCCGRSCVAFTVAVVHVLVCVAAGLATRAPSATTGRSENAKCAAVQSLQATPH